MENPSLQGIYTIPPPREVGKIGLNSAIPTKNAMEIPASRPLPHQSGCYLFKDSSGRIIYVGKAKDLKKRVGSYFSRTQANPKTAALVRNIASIDFVVVDSESEAILLESSLIKQHYPKYNIDLKETMRETYALVTDEKFPRIMLARRNREGRHSGPPGRLYGPFMSSGRPLILGPLRKTFRIRTCRMLPKKVCLQYHMRFCDGPCEGKISGQEYGARIAQAEKILSDQKNIDGYLDELAMRMRKEAAMRNFEEAMKLRDSIRALQGLTARQKMETMTDRDEDYVVVHAEGGRALAQVWRMVRGVIRERLKYEFDYVEDDVHGAFLMKFYSAHNVPKNICVNTLPRDAAAAGHLLASMRGGAVALHAAPSKGSKADLMGLIGKNIISEKTGGADPALLLLQKELSLERMPLTIECFDISNLQGTNVVASMVRLVNAIPKKSEYRKFRMRTVEGQDDFASMREAVFRRYRRLRDEGAPMPDLVLVDGGLGQLHAALDALKLLEMELPVFALAKENEEIYGPDMIVPLRLMKNSEALHVLQRARDEAHRFVIAYHRKLRAKKMTGGKD